MVVIKTLFILIALFLFMMQNASAKKEYQYELDFKKISFNNNSSQQSNNRITFTYFRKPLLNGDYPYAETSFIDRNSSLTLSTEYIFLNYALDNITSKNAAIFGQYSEKSKPYTLALLYLDTRGNGDVANELIDLKNQALTLKFGWYATKKTQVVASYSKLLSKQLRDDNLAFDKNSDVYRVHFNHLFSFSNKHYLKIVSVFSKKKSVDDNYIQNIRRIYSTYKAILSADYYFSKSFSIGILGARNRVLNPTRDGGARFSVKLTKYYTPYTSMDFKITEYKADNDDRDNDFDVLAFSISHRF